MEKNTAKDIPMINERIRFPKIRVISDDGEQLGIMTPREAMAVADEKELDLVLVGEKSDPPRVPHHGLWQVQI